MIRALTLISLVAACEGKTESGAPPDDTSTVVDSTPTGTDTGPGPDPDDADGDGYTAAVDCDDTDASVHPAADEVWYDGVDQDCDGADDDQDGDGHPRADDCDDTDPTVHPDAGEVAADGVDQDCDGEDLTVPTNEDRDGDGYGGGVDCDDADASVHPGATEVWYDGVDQDCDGADDDQDGDGRLRADDCDDTDPAAFPGAPETTGDGVDQDCDGGDRRAVTSLGRGDLVITELLTKPDAVDEAYGEWIEVHNATADAVDLDGLVVSFEVLGLGFTVAGEVEVGPGGYAILAREGDAAINGGLVVDYDYRSDLALDNDAETLTLSAGATEIDTVAWDDAAFFPDTRGASLALDPGSLDADANDDGQYWCPGARAFGEGDLGTPGSANDACPDLEDVDGDGYVAAHDCDDGDPAVNPGASEVARDGVDGDCDGADYAGDAFRSGTVLLTEILQNPDAVSDADGEWFEVYNTTTTTVNLRGLGVGDGTAVQFTVDADVIVGPSSYAVLAVDADAAVNGGVEADYDYPGSLFDLLNSVDTIELTSGTTTVDEVTWDNGKAFPDPVGASMSLSAGGFSATRNDQGAYWCEATSFIGGDPAADRGTPGAANDGC